MKPENGVKASQEIICYSAWVGVHSAIMMDIEGLDETHPFQKNSLVFSFYNSYYLDVGPTWDDPLIFYCFFFRIFLPILFFLSERYSYLYLFPLLHA